MKGDSIGPEISFNMIFYTNIVIKFIFCCQRKCSFPFYVHITSLSITAGYQFGPVGLPRCSKDKFISGKPYVRDFCIFQYNHSFGFCYLHQGIIQFIPADTKAAKR